ncbi:hypothetical protein QZH41_012584, partial [Actinostola sp. cb2023]
CYLSTTMFQKDKNQTSKYEQLRLECLREGKLHEDNDFPANDSSLYSKDPLKVKIEWKRPGEMCRNPKFFSDGANRHDVAQGKLQNCWLNGSYDALNFGLQSESLQDLTGGVVERIKMSNAPYNLLELMKKAIERNSLLGTCIVPKPNEHTLHLPNGLITGHSYSINAIRKVELCCLPDRPVKHLIRLRNPWGSGGEWKGPWSDESREWKMLSERQKYELDLTYENDGEFWVKLSDPDEENENDCCSMVIALMRKDRRRLHKDTPIGFAVYKVPSIIGKNERLSRAFFESNHAVAKTNLFTKEREITLRSMLVPGEYAIIPSTYEANQGADFLLRVFSEKSHDTREVDTKTELLGPPRLLLGGLPVARRVEKWAFFFLWPQIANRPKLPTFDRQRFDKSYKKFFHDIAGDVSETLTLDTFTLDIVIASQVKLKLPLGILSYRRNNSVSHLDLYNDNGVVEYEEFVELCMMMKIWKRHFQYYDRDNSGDMDIFELREALKGL